MLRGGLKEGIVRNSPYGLAVTEAARKNADAASAGFRNADFKIFKGPMMTNDGRQIIAAGKEYANNDLWLKSMDWLTEGVVGSTKG